MPQLVEQLSELLHYCKDDPNMGMGAGGTMPYSGSLMLDGDGIVLYLLFLPLHDLSHQYFGRPLKHQNFCHSKEKANSQLSDNCRN